MQESNPQKRRRVTLLALVVYLITGGCIVHLHNAAVASAVDEQHEKDVQDAQQQVTSAVESQRSKDAQDTQQQVSTAVHNEYDRVVKFYQKNQQDAQQQVTSAVESQRSKDEQDTQQRVSAAVRDEYNRLTPYFQNNASKPPGFFDIVAKAALEEGAKQVVKKAFGSND